MTQFYKSDLSDDISEWEEASITEKLGTPEEHTDKFYRRGPYGVEEDDDGHFEAYVLVSDTPFKIGDGFSSFEEAVGFLRDSMKEKKVPDTPEDKTEQEDAESIEKSDMKVGPEGGSVSKSFEDAYGYPDYDSMPDDVKEMYEEESREQAARSMRDMEDQKNNAFYKADEGECHETAFMHPEDVNERHYIDDKPLGSAKSMSKSPGVDSAMDSPKSIKEMIEFKKANSHSSPRSKSTFDSKRDLRTKEQKEAEWERLMVSRPELTGDEAWAIVEKNKNMPPKQKYIENRHQNEEDKGVAYVPTQSSVAGKFMMPLNENEEVRLKAGKRYMGADKLMHDPVPFDDKTLERRKGWGRKRGLYPQTEPGRRPTPDEWKYATEAEGEGITRGPATQTEWDPKIEHRGNYKDVQGDRPDKPRKRETFPEDEPEISQKDMELAQRSAERDQQELEKRRAQKEARRQRAAERQAKAQQESEAPKAESEAPKAESEAPKEESKPENSDSEDPLNPTTKSFKKMLEQKVGMKESQRGIPTTHMDVGHPMRDGVPIRELYRTTVMGSGKDRTSPFTPKKAETKE